MDNDLDTNVVDSTEPPASEIVPVTASTIYRDLLAKRALWNEEDKKKKKKDKKGEGKKSKNELALDVYDTYHGNFSVIDGYNPFLREQSRFREGNVIPEMFQLNLYSESGFFFGRKFEPNGYIGKPTHEDGHIMGVGFPGSGKTQAIVIPSMMTWRGSQIIIDVKGDLYRHWLRLNKHTGKKVKVFSPGAPKGASCVYDPYSLLRKGGKEKRVGNARDLALALMPLMPSIKDPVWIKATQNYLTGVIIYHFDMGATFLETMVAIQLTDITEMLQEIKSSDGNEEAKSYIKQLSAVQDKVIANTGMELSNLATLITDPAILNAFFPYEGSKLLDWLDLNTMKEPCDIILEFPEENLEQWEPLIMLMINQLIKSLERRPPRTYNKDTELPPVLVMLDEFPRLGKISAIENGLRTLRSRGVTFALFVQSLADLDETYGPITARVIADICTYKVVLGVADVISQEYFTKAVGATESTQRSVNANHDPKSGAVTSYGRSINETRESIIYPEEFLTLKDVVVITPKSGFFRVNKTLFIENKETFLLPQLSKNPDYVAQNPLTYSYK